MFRGAWLNLFVCNKVAVRFVALGTNGDCCYAVFSFLFFFGGGVSFCFLFLVVLLLLLLLLFWRVLLLHFLCTEFRYNSFLCYFLWNTHVVLVRRSAGKILTLS